MGPCRRHLARASVSAGTLFESVSLIPGKLSWAGSADDSGGPHDRAAAAAVQDLGAEADGDWIRDVTRLELMMEDASIVSLVTSSMSGDLGDCRRRR